MLETILDKVKPRKKQFSARDAYMTAKYGRIEDNEKMLKQFYEDTEELIKSKSDNGKYCAMTEIDIDIAKYADRIIEHYKRLGFQVLKLSNKTMVNKVQLNNLQSIFIILVWNSLVDEPNIYGDGCSESDE